MKLCIMDGSMAGQSFEVKEEITTIGRSSRTIFRWETFCFSEACQDYQKWKQVLSRGPGAKRTLLTVIPSVPVFRLKSRKGISSPLAMSC
jgi:hypothetical protein